MSDTGGMILFGHQSTTSVSFDDYDDVEGNRQGLTIWPENG